MKVNTIIRGCNVKDDSETERELLEKRISEKVENIAVETKKNMLTLLEVFSDSMVKKIDEIEKYKEELRNEYDEKIKLLQREVKNTKNEVIDIGEELKEEGLKRVDKYLEDSKEEIKDLTLMIFEKIFHTEYRNLDNLDSLIKHELNAMEERKEIKISINKKLINTKDELEKLSSCFSEDERIVFKTHSKESLLLEIQNEKETLEYDFDKQLLKIKEVMKEFK